MIVTPLAARRAHELPHVAPQFDVDTRSRLVEKQYARFVRERLGDQHAALHAARERDDLAIALFPQRQIAQHLFDVGRVFWLAEQTAAEGNGRPDGFEGVGGEFLRHEADERARAAIIARDVAAVDRHRAFACIHNAANDADQRGFTGAVRPEQSEDFSAIDRQIDVFQSMKTRGIGFRQIRNRDDWLHGFDDGRHRYLIGRRRNEDATAPAM